MYDKELYVPGDVLEEASAARYQMLPTKIKITSEQKTMNESEVNERETFRHR
jgi:hypothetical protein